MLRNSVRNLRNRSHLLLLYSSGGGSHMQLVLRWRCLQSGSWLMPYGFDGFPELSSGPFGWSRSLSIPFSSLICCAGNARESKQKSLSDFKSEIRVSGERVSGEIGLGYHEVLTY